MKVASLKNNERNPRFISQEKREGLRRSVEKFGDLGGIIYNIRSERLVGGHQRSSLLDPTDSIVKTQRYKEPTTTGTVAEGYVIHNEERYAYREVDWDKTTESEAMLAANKHSGEWDNDLLRVIFADVKDISVTGFEMPELSALNITMPDINVTPLSEQIPTENPNQNLKVEPKTFEGTEEQASKHIQEKRFVIIINCSDDAHKKSLKDKIQPIVDEAGGQFF